MVVAWRALVEHTSTLNETLETNVRECPTHVALSSSMHRRPPHSLPMGWLMSLEECISPLSGDDIVGPVPLVTKVHDRLSWFVLVLQRKQGWTGLSDGKVRHCW